MNRRILSAAGGVLLLGLAGIAAVRGAGPLPPLGPLLDPAHGVWATARAALPLGNRTIKARIFEGEVQAVVDARGVPHIYAEHELDAYRALGYLVARDRLFQLELQTRAAAGTLTELVGARALSTDRESRRFGFGRLVERRLAAVDSQSGAFRAMTAYAEGINAWIGSMRPGDIPLEYRLLGKTPARWDARNTYFLLARMALMLAYNDPSIVKTRAAARIGWPAAEALFPVEAPIQEPIQPNPGDTTRARFDPIPPPGLPDSAARTLLAGFDALPRWLASVRGNAEDAIGSNNWAVAPFRSASGRALLAGDPHLELSLPSIWYQAHLVVPGQLDVAGVTMPGAPWVIIGFNRDIAWSFTNTGADVNDFYRETVDDAGSPTTYQLDGTWHPLELRVETYRSPTGAVLATDTVRFTHRGPLWRVDGGWLSMAWTVYRSEMNGAEFQAIERVRSVPEFLAATSGFSVPAQNMLVADRHGSIAIRSTGTYPIRPYSGRGDVIRDGSQSAADWTANLPPAEYPFAQDPPQGFLSSANQQPVDPAANARYFGAHWYSPWRAIRINDLLRGDPAVTADAMRQWQVDPGSARADAFMPFLLGTGLPAARLAAAPSKTQDARALLAEWDRRYTLTNTGAVLFEAVMAELARRTWDELAGPDSVARVPDEAPVRPADALLLGLLRQPQNSWWDDRRTAAAVETRDEILEASLAAGLDSVVARYGAPGDAWQWNKVHHANINHLLRIPALSALGLGVAGGPSTLSPTSGRGTSGASWRMVVELGSEVRAWGIYPGGQSGNPVSRHYRDQLPAWLGGQLDSLVVPATIDQFPAEMPSRLVFTGGSR